ncbi:MAG: bacillithiol system redox-active protein YtxJ [Saprospirales bacterium]|nr:bacillithiol system redox-active protein YtxJ [Saprospirales bacterium]MBK8492292.1 bacillithiol system redox-active protein YtxJ [Saprospirales bacterium]
MNWIDLQTTPQVEEIVERSRKIPCILFKHSTRCSISTVAKYRLEGDWDLPNEAAELYFLDLIAHRDVSNYIAEKFQVYHESPQVLVIRDGECVLDVSHLDITVPELRECLQEPA